MHYDVVEARHIEGYKLELVFENGKKGIVDLKMYIHRGGVFSRFSDIEYFKQFYVNSEHCAGLTDWILHLKRSIMRQQANLCPHG
jgi:hypothetical protein